MALLRYLLKCPSRFQAFQVLSEYLQLLDSFSELSAVQEMSRGVEVSIELLLRSIFGQQIQ